MSCKTLNILIVEDDEDDFFLLKEELLEIEQWELHIEWVSTIEEANQEICNDGFDVFLLDYNLGEKTSLQLLESIPIHKISGPVIMITGQNDKRVDQRALEAGVADFLVKGKFDAEILERSIRYAIERKKVDRQKAEFVSVISHELRTPLTSIKGSLELISVGATGEINEETKTMIKISSKNCDRLIKIVNDLLDTQKLCAGRLEIQSKPTNLVPLLKTALEAHAGYVQKPDDGLKFIYFEDEAWIRGDEARLLQVMANLLSNASKFSPKDGQIIVKLDAIDSQKIRVSVIDQGPGIPEQFQASIWGKFNQVDSTNERKHGGTGLGLNIAKSIIELHGGIIDFDTSDGKGTSFYFELPLLADHAG